MLLATEKDVLRAMVEGALLRHHSDLDGRKRFALHEDDAERAVRAWAVATLQARGLVLSNDKFPTSTFYLTGKGKRVAATLTARALAPVAARRPEDG